MACDPQLKTLETWRTKRARQRPRRPNDQGETPTNLAQPETLEESVAFLGHELYAPARSLAAERFHGIDGSGAAGRDDARKGRPASQGRSCDSIRQRIQSRNVIEQRRDPARNSS